MIFILTFTVEPGQLVVAASAEDLLAPRQDEHPWRWSRRWRWPSALLPLFNASASHWLEVRHLTQTSSVRILSVRSLNCTRKTPPRRNCSYTSRHIFPYYMHIRLQYWHAYICKGGRPEPEVFHEPVEGTSGGPLNQQSFHDGLLDTTLQPPDFFASSSAALFAGASADHGVNSLAPPNALQTEVLEVAQLYESGAAPPSTEQPSKSCNTSPGVLRFALGIFSTSCVRAFYMLRPTSYTKYYVQ